MLIALVCELNGELVSLQADPYINEDSVNSFSISLQAPPSVAALSDALDEEGLHYSQAIWNQLTAQEVAMTLGSYNLGGRPLIEQIDPAPRGVYGNYLMFHWHFEDDEWKDWVKDQRKAAGISTELVPVPTGGVFGEAVLGRFNASEKLDITRYWNWQDSPIPHQAPDIAAIQAGSRTTNAPLESPGFSAPIINQLAPVSLPNPGSTDAIVQSVLTGFRNMSGVGENAQLAGSLTDNATSAGANAAHYAGAALHT